MSITHASRTVASKDYSCLVSHGGLEPPTHSLEADNAKPYFIRVCGHFYHKSNSQNYNIFLAKRYARFPIKRKNNLFTYHHFSAL